jgi:hypothetical protein
MAPHRLIYVPGVRPKPAPEVHQAVLAECLGEGIRRADPELARTLPAATEWLRLVSWGSIFYPEHRDLALDRPAIDALLAEAPSGPASLPELRSWPYRLRYGSHLLGDRFPFLINLMAGPSTRFNIGQTERYFENRNGESDRIRALVAEALEEAWSVGARVLLMAHSLGSVIAYETLWELGRRPGGPRGTVDLFLTLGSPLGTRFIRRRLKGRNCRGADRYPRGIREWRNLAARGGLTALGQRLEKQFGEMVSLGLVERITDRMDLVNPFRGEEGLNVHRCYGYFVNPVTGEAIARWWRGQPAAPLP